MLNINNLEKFIKQAQTNTENVIREYCQHLFLSNLYQRRGSEKLLFKGGTALQMVFHSPRFSEDLDFTGANITSREIEAIFTDTLASIEQTGIPVDLVESKNTTGGHLGIAVFNVYDKKILIQIEISLRHNRNIRGVRVLIENDYVPAYTLVHLPMKELILGKTQALLSRHKPRDFYDYFFLLSGNYPVVKDRKNLELVLKSLRKSKINFRAELKKFLPASHSLHLKDFKRILEKKILNFLGD